jgi:hypothetical protein
MGWVAFICATVAVLVVYFVVDRVEQKRLDRARKQLAEAQEVWAYEVDRYIAVRAEAGRVRAEMLALLKTTLATDEIRFFLTLPARREIEKLAAKWQLEQEGKK